MRFGDLGGTDSPVGMASPRSRPPINLDAQAMKEGPGEIGTKVRTNNGGVRWHRAIVACLSMVMVGYAFGLNDPSLWMFLRGYAAGLLVQLILEVLDD